MKILTNESNSANQNFVWENTLNIISNSSVRETKGFYFRNFHSGTSLEVNPNINYEIDEKVVFPANYQVGQFRFRRSFTILVTKTKAGLRYSNVRMNIYVEESNMDDLRASIIEELEFLKLEYGLCDEKLLGNSAITMKNWINNLIAG